MKTLNTMLILAMTLVGGVLAQVQPQPAVASNPVPEIANSGGSGMPAVPTGFSISYVKSDRKWRYGLRSEPYNKISEYFQTKLTEGLEAKEIHLNNKEVAPSCTITLELLDVSIRPAFIKKPGMDVAATVTILGPDQHPLYSKGYRGESKTVFNTYGHLINHAIENMVESILADSSAINALVNGHS